MCARFLLLGFFWLIALPAGSAVAEAYSYVDAQGKLHFVDSLHLVPEAYRDQVETVENGNGQGGIEDLLGVDSYKLHKQLFVEFNNLRKASGMLALSHADKREWTAFFRKWTPILLGTHALLLVIVVIVILHGFINGHPIWAIANILFMGFPAPIYSILHLGPENPALKWTISFLALVPTAAFAWFAWSLYQLLARFLGL